MTLVAAEVHLPLTHLVPFIVSVAVYFLLFIPYDKPSLFAAIVKCAPIVSLIYFVTSNIKKSDEERYQYSRKILCGLLFCCVGDVFLLWNKYFAIGMVAFILGHIQYIRAFGFKPLKLHVGLVVFILGGIVFPFIYHGLKGVLLIGVPIYIFVINTMVWRAISRLKNPISFIQACTCFGSLCFAFSDFIIGMDKFRHPVEYSQVLIMSTYYAAQLGISLSTLESTEQGNS